MLYQSIKKDNCPLFSVIEASLSAVRHGHFTFFNFFITSLNTSHGIIGSSSFIRREGRRFPVARFTHCCCSRVNFGAAAASDASPAPPPLPVAEGLEGEVLAHVVLVELAYK